MFFFPHLHSDFWQVDLHGQLLPGVDVGVVGLFEGPLQLVQLVGGEGGPVAAVLLAVATASAATTALSSSVRVLDRIRETHTLGCY